MSRHRHQWTEVGRVFSPSVGGTYTWIDNATFERLAFGVTSIELRCDCGDVSERQLLGDHVSSQSSRIKG